MEILFWDTLIEKFSKFSFFFCSSIKEPDQYDYYADEKPVLYKGIADLYTVSKVKQFRRENSNSLTFFKPTERCVIFVILANFVVNNWSSIKNPERNRSRSRNLYNDFLIDLLFAGTAERSHHCEHYRCCFGRFGHFDAVYPQMWRIP